jgi:hypothetical protein
VLSYLFKTLNATLDISANITPEKLSSLTFFLNCLFIDIEEENVQFIWKTGQKPIQPKNGTLTIICVKKIAVWNRSK